MPLPNVLNHVPDTSHACAIATRITRTIARGSYLAICHPTAEIDADQMRAATELRNDRAAPPAATASS